MNIAFSPQRSELPLSVEKYGDVLIINGVETDFSVIPDDCRAPHDAFDSPLVAEASRTSGVLTVTFLLPHGANPPPHVAFPEAIENAADGVVPIPQEQP